MNQGGDVGLIKPDKSTKKRRKIRTWMGVSSRGTEDHVQGPGDRHPQERKRPLSGRCSVVQEEENWFISSSHKKYASNLRFVCRNEILNSPARQKLVNAGRKVKLGCAYGRQHTCGTCLRCFSPSAMLRCPLATRSATEK